MESMINKEIPTHFVKLEALRNEKEKYMKVYQEKKISGYVRKYLTR